MHRFLLAALVAAFFVPTANAQPQCANRAEILALLAEQYGETVVAMGFSGPALMEVYASEIGSWTILFTPRPDVSCIMASGEAWEAIEPHFPVQGEDG